MYSQLYREISQLKQDRFFVRNLGFTATVAIAVSLTLADLQASFTTTSERDSNPAISSTRLAAETAPFFR